MRFALAMFVIGIAAPFAVQMSAEDPGATAVKRAIPLMQSSARTWTDRAGCISCHHQILGSMALTVASERGFEVDDMKVRYQIQTVVESRSKPILRMYEGQGAIGQQGFIYTLFGLGAVNRPEQELSDAIVRFIELGQAADGGWIQVSHRQPLEDARESVTAFAIRDLSLYGGQGARDNISKGTQWLIKSKPQHMEGRSMRLLGLVWGGAPSNAIKDASSDVLRQQGTDGGWAQLPGMQSDSYATGQAVVALRLAGYKVSDSRLKKAISFLIQTQEKDGSWHVTTRRKAPGLPYFESGFPHGIDQFISYAGTAWAVTAIAMDQRADLPATLTRTSIPKSSPRTPQFAESPSQNRLFVAIAHNSLPELKAALANGADANGKNLQGSTPLHWAVFNYDMTKALLDAGASTDSISRERRTPLHAAALFGNTKTVTLLLDHGAKVSAVSSGGNTPLVDAVQSFDIDKLKLLLQHGADPNPKGHSIAPLALAVWVENNEAIKELLRAGADVNAATTDAVAGLNEMALALLLAKGANPNLGDEDGLKPLHIAAMLYAGNDRLAALLLKAGADPSAKDPEGHTPLELSRIHGNKPVENLLISVHVTS